MLITQTNLSLVEETDNHKVRFHGPLEQAVVGGGVLSRISQVSSPANYNAPLYQSSDHTHLTVITIIITLLLKHTSHLTPVPSLVQM